MLQLNHKSMVRGEYKREIHPNPKENNIKKEESEGAAVSFSGKGWKTTFLRDYLSLPKRETLPR